MHELHYEGRSYEGSICKNKALQKFHFERESLNFTTNGHGH